VTEFANTSYLLQLNNIFTGIFNATFVGLAVFDAETRVVLSNRAFAFMVANSTVPSFVGKTIREILGRAADELEFAVKAVFDGNMSHLSVDISTKVSHSGLVNHCLFSLVPIEDPAKGLTQVAAITVETSHQKRIEQYFLTMMGDISWIRAQISSDPPDLRDFSDRLCPNEEAGLLDLVSKELRSISEMVNDTRNASWNVAEALAQSEPAKQDASASSKPGEFAALSPRERQVLVLAGKGKDTKEIASLLDLSPSTVSTYRTRLERKLGLHSPVEVALYAVQKRAESP